MPKYIGMDVHSKTCMFVVVDEKGKELIAQRVNTSEGEILKFVRSIPRKKALAFEESNLSKWLYPILKDEVDELVICNPAYVIRKPGPKNDYSDTVHLAQQLRGGFLSSVFHADHFFSELRTLVSAYEDVTRQITSEKNRYKALFRAQAQEASGKKIYRDLDRIQSLPNEVHQFVGRTLFDQIRLLEEIRADYVKQFEKYVKKYPEIQALTSLPGISTVRATMIAAIVISPDRFENKHKFWSYSMLVRHDRQSDGRSYGKVTIRANATLKTIFIGAAEKALEGDSSFRKYYDQLREKGLDHKAARKNVARKIAAISLAIMRTKKTYEEDYEVKKLEKSKLKAS